VTLSAHKISIIRGGLQVLHEVDVHLKTGQITAICGPNGAGKSSLLSSLAGLLEIAEGSVTLADQELEKIPLAEKARSIGYLPQAAEVAWDVAVENLVRLGRLPYRDRGDEAVEQAIAAMDLTELRTRPASTLSGGEKARALLARVLAGEPQWILADEPLSALDLSHQLALLRQLRASAEQGCGVVLVLHDLAMAMNHADRVLVLKEGRLIADGLPQISLSEDIIADVWGVSARWLGEPGAHALIAD
jgi:iron complex transport system ATP-binding protein